MCMPIINIVDVVILSSGTEETESEIFPSQPSKSFTPHKVWHETHYTYTMP